MRRIALIALAAVTVAAAAAAYRTVAAQQRIALAEMAQDSDTRSSRTT